MTDQATRTDVEEHHRDGTTTWLMLSGIADPSAAARIADATITAGFTDDTDDQGFFTFIQTGANIGIVFAKLCSGDRIRLGNLIAHQTNHDEWPRWLHNALSDAENGDRIETGRKHLAEHLDHLAQTMAAVHAAHQRLLDEHDVEYAEETLFRTYLDQAHLAIRTAIAVNPVKPEDR